MLCLKYGSNVNEVKNSRKYLRCHSSTEMVIGLLQNNGIILQDEEDDDL